MSLQYFTNVSFYILSKFNLLALFLLLRWIKEKANLFFFKHLPCAGQYFTAFHLSTHLILKQPSKVEIITIHLLSCEVQKGWQSVYFR
jgi:hypothetical protein